MQADAPEGGTGSVALPFARIADAIAKVESGPSPAIIVHPGEYRENLVVTPPLHLEAACNVRLLPATDQQPVIRIEGRGASDVTRIEGFEIVGGSAGIEVHEASTVVVENTRLVDTEGPAVIAEASGASDIRLRSVLIENARGAGVTVYGARLSIQNSTIRGTRAAPEGEDSCGVCVRPSARVQMRDVGWDARTSNVGSLSLERSLLEDNTGAGVSVIGAEATVSGSVIRARAGEQTTGLNVEERVLGNLPARLTVSQSLVERTTRTGIRARNAYLTVDKTIVRDIRGTADSGTRRCFGNGVRVIWDRPAEASEPALRLRESSIDGTGETGVLIQGARALIEDSHVRGSLGARCGIELGDGIAVYGHEFAPGKLELTKTRIERSARASVASFGHAEVDMLSSVALGGAIAGDSVQFNGGHLCARLGEDRWSPCVAQSSVMPSALLGGGPCDAGDDTVCIRICSHEAGNPSHPLGVVFAPKRRFWILGHDEIAPVQSDPLGCAEIEGLPRNTHLTLVTAVDPEPNFVPIDPHAELTEVTRAFAPALNQVNTTASDSGSNVHVGGQYDYELFAHIAVAPARAGVPASGLDLRTAPAFAVVICDAFNERPTPPMSCQPLAGVSVSIDSGNLAHYPISTSASSMGTATVSSSIGALALFINVPAGPRRFELVPDDRSRKLQCRADTGANWSTATELADNVFEVLVRPGYAINTMVFCELSEAEQH